ncbi:cobalamin-dependent protein [Pseudomonas sp. CAU 1711]|uniref:cobalamin-dependent protein n=1 Tax=Pseudomonas sp. CAU 1711 TaxID=3140356 RepID=UPI0032610253
MVTPTLRILLINPPHTAIGSRIPGEHLPPLGLLSIGGPLLDAGFRVQLLDADLDNLALDEIVRRAAELAPDVVMLGHSGSSSVHLTVVELCALLKRRLPALRVIYGGVHPTYH